MTLLERALRPVSLRPDPPGGVTPWLLRARGAAAGGFAAGSVFLVLCLPVLLAWIAGPDSSIGWGSATAVAATAWTLGLGVSVHVGSGPTSATLSVTPLLITAAQLAVAVLSARYLLRQLPGRPAQAARSTSHEMSAGRARQAVCHCAAGFVGAYVLVALALAFACAPAGVHASPFLACLAAAGWSAACVAFAAVAALGDDIVPRRAHGRGVPAYAVRAVGPAVWGAAALLAAGTLLVLGSVLLHLGRVGQLSSSLDPGPVGQVVLAVVQLLVVPDLAMWAVAFVAGPGFTLVTGSSVTWSTSQPGTLPVIPVFGALPDPGALPGWLPVVALVPVAAGALLAWRAQRPMSALTSWRLRAQVTGIACLISAGLLILLAFAASGSLGGARLSAVGPRVALTGIALLGELTLGALLATVVLGRRARRRLQPPT